MAGSSSSPPGKANTSRGQKRKKIEHSDSDSVESLPLHDSSPSSTITPQSQTQPLKDASTTLLSPPTATTNVNDQSRKRMAISQPQEQGSDPYPYNPRDPVMGKDLRPSTVPNKSFPSDQGTPVSGLAQEPSIMNQMASTNMGSSNDNILGTQEEASSALNQRPSSTSQNVSGLAPASSILNQRASDIGGNSDIPDFSPQNEEQKSLHETLEDVIEQIKNMEDVNEAKEDSDA